MANPCLWWEKIPCKKFQILKNRYISIYGNRNNKINMMYFLRISYLSYKFLIKLCLWELNLHELLNSKISQKDKVEFIWNSCKFVYPNRSIHPKHKYFVAPKNKFIKCDKKNSKTLLGSLVAFKHYHKWKFYSLYILFW